MNPLEKFFVISSKNPNTNELEFCTPDEWGDYWQASVLRARRYDNLENAVLYDGMAPKGSLAAGRVLEVLEIYVSVNEVFTFDQKEQFEKEQKLKKLLEQKAAIQAEIDNI